MQEVIIIFRIRIRELRESAGYTSQQAFANAFGVAQSTVGNWEAGKREPGYETTIRLADFFNVSVDYLIGRIDKGDKKMKFYKIESDREDQIEDRENFFKLSKERRIEFVKSLMKSNDNCLPEYMEDTYMEITQDHKASNSIDLPSEIARQYNADTATAFSMYLKLDSGDQGEIRGEMKGMLKNKKYFSQESFAAKDA